MNSDQNVTAVASPLENFPMEIWLKIISLLPLHDRCRLECVNRQLSKVANSSWAQAQPKKLQISSTNINSEAKLATLLRRCGVYLEEIIVERHIQLDTEAQLLQLCPNVKVLSFTRGVSLAHSGCPIHPEVELNPNARRFLESLPKLQRLQLFNSVDYENDGPNVVVITLRRIVPGLKNLPNLHELHLPFTLVDVRSVRCVDLLPQHIRILSVFVPDNLAFDLESPFDLLFTSICQLHQLEQLYIRLSSKETGFFDTSYVDRLAKSLPNLNSLVLRFGWSTGGFGITPVGCINAIIGQFTLLRTLVIVCAMRLFEGTGSDLVDLNQHHYRKVPLNIFVVDYNLSICYLTANFTGYSPQIHVIPVPNGRRYGEAIEFISKYNQNDFNFADQKCLQMVKESSGYYGQWDFAFESDDEGDD